MTSIILGIIIVAVIAAWLYRERENAKERSALADRIQSPFAVQAAAMESVWPEPAEAPDLFTDPVLPERHNDLSLQALLEEA